MRANRRRRWIRGIAIGLGATLVLAIAAGAIVTQTRWGRELVRTQVEHQLAQTFVGGATLGGIEGNPFGTLTLHDLVINGPDGRPAITVKKLDVKVGVLPLLSHQARVLAVHADGVDVDLQRDASGQLAIKGLMRPGPPSAWSVQLPEVTLRHAHVRLDAGSEVMNFDDISIDASANLPHGGPIDATIGLVAAWRERASAALALHAVVHSDERGVEVPVLAARAGGVSVTGNHVVIAKAAPSAPAPPGAPGASDVRAPAPPGAPGASDVRAPASASAVEAPEGGSGRPGAQAPPAGPAPSGQLPVVTGSIVVDAAAAEVARLVPSVQLPADVSLAITAARTSGPPWTDLTVAGRVDHTPVRFTGSADLDARHARGELSTGTLDVSKLSRGKVVGTAAATATFDVRPGEPDALPIATATIRGWGAIAGVPRTALDVTLTSAGQRARAVVDAHGDAVHAALAADVRLAGEQLTIESATLHATATDPARASGGKAPVHGGLRIDLKASGAVRPAPSLAVAGTIEGTKLRMAGLSVAALHVTVDARRLPSRPLGKAHVQLVDLVRADMHLGELTVDAADRTDGKVAVAVRSRPKPNPWLFDADALVTPPGHAGAGRVAIELGGHHVRVGNGTEWRGRGGRIDIGPERISIADLVSASTMGRLAVSGSYDRAGRGMGDLTAHVDAKSVSLDSLGGPYRGKVDAQLAVTRQRGAWQGEVRLDGKGVAVRESAPPLDGNAHVALHGRRLEVTADATSQGVGSARLAVDLRAPAVITDAAAWKRLDRGAISRASLTLRGIEIRRAAELAGLQGEYAGRINGDIQIDPTTIGGRVEASQLLTPSSRGVVASAVLDLSQPQAQPAAPAAPAAGHAPGGPATAPDARAAAARTAAAAFTGARPRLTVTATDIGSLTAQAELAVPDHWFDPAAWKRLGRGALHGASLRVESINVDPAMLERFGVTSQLRGKVGVAIELGEAARTVQAVVDVAGVRGGPISQPIDVQVKAAVDDRATTATITAATKGGQLIDVTGHLPVSLPRLLDRSGGPGTLRDTPLSAIAKLTSVDAAHLIAVFGRTEITGGTIDGSIQLAGTLGRPRAKLDLRGTRLVVPPGPHGKPVRIVPRLAITGGWDGETARLDIDGAESAGGTLKVTAVARPDALRDGSVTIKASKFDLVPLLVFAPGPAGGAAGELDADLRMTGLDLRTTQLTGELHLRDARIPIAPAVGTLRSARVDAAIADHSLLLKVDGKLGAGTVAVNGSVALDGAAPNGGKAKITLHKVSPIGGVEPQITADIAASLSRKNNQWHADLVVDQASVEVPENSGEKLKPVGAPADMRFASGERITRRPLRKEEPASPIFVVTVNLHSTRVESKEFRGDISGKIELRADGQAIAITGGIEADRGDLDLFAQRYYVERAGVHFDGSPDPLLDIRITHDFPEVTTITEVRGRLSKPELVMTSDPGTYSQGQLLGFLLGGQPGGDPAGSVTDRATSAGESYVANQIGGYVKKALPINIDVLRYEAATSTTSAAIIVGTWISDALFLAYRQHLESRPDENTGEGEIEYWLSHHLLIEGTVGNRNVDGVDLLWRKRY